MVGISYDTTMTSTRTDRISNQLFQPEVPLQGCMKQCCISRIVAGKENVSVKYIYINTPSINHLISSRSKTGIKNYFHLCRKALADLTTVKQTASFIFLLVTLTMELLYTSASNTHTHTDSGYLGLQVSYHFQYQLVCLLISVLIGWF